MVRTGFVCTVLAAVLLTVGCEEPVKDGDIYRIDPSQLSRVMNTGFSVPEAAEVDLVEAMAASRAEYYANLEALQRFYAARGNRTKRVWAEKELASIGQIAQYQYLTPWGSGSADLRGINSYEEADILFNDAMRLYTEAGGLLIITDDNKLRMALNKFNQLVSDYPSSDKIDDCAYRAGRIYEHFGDPEIAVICYQRCFQWNPETSFPARFRAAKIFDRLSDRDKALTLYRMAVQLESQYADNVEYAQERIWRLTKPKSGPSVAPAPSPEIPETPGEM